MHEIKVAELLIKELKRANKFYGTSFASPHEGYAVMLEEMDELFDEIRKKRPDNERLHEEAIQVGAMAIKFITSIEDWTRVENQSTIEANCRKCSYNVMSPAELAGLGSDPCETCDSDLSNWATMRRDRR